MSFAYDVKKDLCDGKKSHKRCCQLAELYGAMLFSHCFEESKIHLVSENRLVPDHFVSRLQEVLRVEAKVEQKNQQGAYHVYVEDPAKLHKIWEKLGIQRVDDTGELAIDRSLLQKTCCVAAFLRGVFLVCGTISNPEKGYHLEFSSPHRHLSGCLFALLWEMGLNPKHVKRKNSYVIYFKESENIEDILNILGATKSAFALMEVKVTREVRNQVNRRVNCETANSMKTAQAAAKQVMAIQKIMATKGLESLPDGLILLAKMRLEHPDMSLKELGEKMEPPITRHGVNHRMKKLLEIAEEIESDTTT